MQPVSHQLRRVRAVAPRVVHTLIFVCLVEITILLNFTFRNLGTRSLFSCEAWRNACSHLRGGAWIDGLEKNGLARHEDTIGTQRGEKALAAEIGTSRKPLDEGAYIPPLQARRSRFGPEKTDVISACLMVKDDNHILSEWIGYHYSTLPLRHLVVGVDPLSESSPADILRRWNKDTSGKNADYPEMDMDIHIWGDEEIYRGTNPETAFKNAYYNNSYSAEKELLKSERAADKPEVVRLNNRLMFFFSRCMEFHKQEQRSWVLLIDSDEFLTFNYMHSDDVTMPPRPPIDEKSGTSTSRGQLRWWRKRANYQADVQKRLPPVENTTIAEFILTEADEHPWKHDDLPCYSFPRLTYGPHESEESQVRYGVPDIANPYHFNTLRFRRHAAKNTNDKNRAGKVMIDVSRLFFEDLWKTSGSPHYLLMHECKIEYRFDTILRANHYLGSWDVYISRPDERRNIHEFKKRGKFKLYFEDDDVRPWIKRFYDQFGKKGINLLQVGTDLINIPGNYSSDISEQLREHFNLDLSKATRTNKLS